MKAVLFLAALTIFITSPLFAQAPPWLWSHSSAPGTSSVSVASDGYGYSAICGIFSEDMAIGGKPLFKRPGPTTDFFAALLDKNGTVEWTVRLGSVLQNHGEVLKVTIDSFHNVYIFGYYQDSAEFADTTMRTPGYTSLFAVKYNSEGKRQWCKTLVRNVEPYDENHQSTYQFSAATDAGYYVFIAGSFTDSADCNGKVLQRTGKKNFFLASFDALDGRLLKAIPFNGKGTCHALRTGSPGSILQVYATGQTIDGHVFFAIFSGGSVLQMHKDTLAGGFGVGKTIALLSDNSLYIGGSFSDSLSYSGVSLKNYSSYFDGFLLKLTPTLTFDWIRQLGGERVDEVLDLAIDEKDNAYISGYFRLKATFGTDVLENPGNAQSNIAFVTKYAKNGTEQWAIKPGGSYSTGKSIAVSDGLLFLSGSGDVSFKDTASGGGLFLAAMKIPTTSVTSSERESHGTICFYPNPGHSNAYLEVELEEPMPIEVIIADDLGRTVYRSSHQLHTGSQTLQFDLSSLSHGAFHCLVKTSGGTVISTNFILE